MDIGHFSIFCSVLLLRTALLSVGGIGNFVRRLLLICVVEANPLHYRSRIVLILRIHALLLAPWRYSSGLQVF
jgi:hypothetical protein